MRIIYSTISIVTVLTMACSNPSGVHESTGGSADTSRTTESFVQEGKIVILDPEGEQIIDSSEKIRNLGGGFTWTEGPLYIADGDYVIFSDIPANKVMKWKEGEGITTYLHPSGYTGNGEVPENEPGSNGLILDKDGKLVLCQHGDRRIARMLAPLNAPKPEYETVAAKYNGKRFNSPNDAIYHSNGNLYLTDPPYGLPKGEDDPARELDFHGVYRVTPEGKVDLVTKEFKWPNGIALTNDGKFLLVGHSDGSNMAWMKYELGEDGLPVSNSLFYRISESEQDKPGAPDGMKMSKKGYLFASGPGGIWIFNSSAKPVARIYTGQATSNCALSADEKTLYMTCDDYFYSVKLK